MLNEFQKTISHGDRVTILVPSGIGREGREYKSQTGVALFISMNGGWVLSMGGRYGTPRIATPENTVKIERRRKERNR